MDHVVRDRSAADQLVRTRRVSLRLLLVFAHRWSGLAIAFFLIVAGLTGALLPFQRDLNRLVAPTLWAAAPPTPGARPMSGVELMKSVEAQTGGTVRYFLLQLDPGYAQAVFVSARPALMAEQARLGGFTVERGFALSLNPRAHAIGYYARTSLDRPTEARQGSTLVWFDAIDGRLLEFKPPFGKTAADTVDKWVRELHVAGVGGLPYRVPVSALGLMTAILSATGVILFTRRQIRKLLSPALLRRR